MKHYFIALSLMLTLNVGQAEAGPRLSHHRHHALTEQTFHPDSAAVTDSVSRAKAARQGIEAYSDTSSADVAEDTAAQRHTGYSNDYDDEINADSFIEKMLGGTLGIGGMVLAIVIVLALLLIALAPFIVCIFLFRYLINRHNKRVELAEQAMASGQPIPEAVKPLKPETPEYYWKRGVKNVSLGIGLAIMFACLGDADFFVGLSLLLACYGVGQLVISKTSK